MLIEENFKEKGCVHLARAPNLHARPEHALSKSFCASCKERAFNTSPQKWLSLKLLVLIMCMAAKGSFWSTKMEGVVSFKCLQSGSSLRHVGQHQPQIDKQNSIYICEPRIAIITGHSNVFFSLS